MKYTIIYYKAVGYRAGQYLVYMKRVRTKDLRAYIRKHDMDPAYIFIGWPALEGEKE